MQYVAFSLGSDSDHLDNTLIEHLLDNSFSEEISSYLLQLAIYYPEYFSFAKDFIVALKQDNLLMPEVFNAIKRIGVCKNPNNWMTEADTLSFLHEEKILSDDDYQKLYSTGVSQSLVNQIGALLITLQGNNALAEEIRDKLIALMFKSPDSDIIPADYLKYAQRTIEQRKEVIRDLEEKVQDKRYSYLLIKDDACLGINALMLELLHLEGMPLNNDVFCWAIGDIFSSHAVVFSLDPIRMLHQAGILNDYSCSFIMSASFSHFGERLVCALVKLHDANISLIQNGHVLKFGYDAVEMADMMIILNAAGILNATTRRELVEKIEEFGREEPRRIKKLTNDGVEYSQAERIADEEFRAAVKQIPYNLIFSHDPKTQQSSRIEYLLQINDCRKVIDTLALLESKPEQFKPSSSFNDTMGQILHHSFMFPEQTEYQNCFLLVIDKLNDVNISNILKRIETQFAFDNNPYQLIMANPNNRHLLLQCLKKASPTHVAMEGIGSKEAKALFDKLKDEKPLSENEGITLIDYYLKYLWRNLYNKPEWMRQFQPAPAPSAPPQLSSNNLTNSKN